MTAQRRPNPRQFVAGALSGALLAYLFDPDRGRSRRAEARDRLAGFARRVGRRMERSRRYAESTMQGWLARAEAAPGPSGPVDDVALAHRVESELFRDPQVPKGRINLNSENGIVVLRGSVDDAMAELIERRVARIPGVIGVRNLFRATGTPDSNDAAAAGVGAPPRDASAA